MVAPQPHELLVGFNSSTRHKFKFYLISFLRIRVTKFFNLCLFRLCSYNPKTCCVAVLLLISSVSESLAKNYDRWRTGVGFYL
jgi:hypothetical protein